MYRHPFGFGDVIKLCVRGLSSLYSLKIILICKVFPAFQGWHWEGQAALEEGIIAFGDLQIHYVVMH